ncbi:hypothetical protein HRI_003954300 [Hibiscus trionum]|uniref:Uncharacterized protein n=1 Tax=Hibiscus trionum TaxID=183268 RepID=A0A9W7IW54_HIBTR|nr:hypothetical protein HRI_003954300 [Hibiscus trionum]
MAPKGAKKKPRVKKIKLDLKEEMEKIKVWSAVLAEMTAVQSELVEGLDLDPDSNTEDLHVESEQLGEVNTQCQLLGSMIENYIHAMLGAFGG